MPLFAWLLPQGAWADNSGLDEAFVGDKQYYVLRSSADWDKFRQLVIDAEGKTAVNAIMDADFSISTGVGSLASDVGIATFPYVGTFNGNGHTLTVSISGTGYSMAPFNTVADGTTIKNLRVVGSVKGGQYAIF